MSYNPFRPIKMMIVTDPRIEIDPGAIRKIGIGARKIRSTVEPSSHRLT